MGQLKKSVFNLSNKESDLRDFKIGLKNRIDFKRVSINLEYNDDEINYWRDSRICLFNSI
ncbi:hypothetical protein [Lentibacillus sediminis]|uniref:hypothetical protein n=1 Tax=Lentibacillus sediminis TaxID=1940529 RepID=UPI000C1C01CA|nr:hypothetical protein [Lentibacillus sediminis]